MQKTKISIECAKTLRTVVEEVFSETDADREKMIVVYMSTLKKLLEEEETRIPHFILKHINNIINPPEEKVPWQIQFMKDPKHEDFIRGCMKRQCYTQKDFEGPLMR